MRPSEYAGYDATGLAELVRRREITSLELALSAIDAIEKVNPRLNAVVEIFPDLIDRLRRQVPRTGVFAGVPILNKDLLADAGRKLEMGSELARGFVAPYTDCLPGRLKRQGAVVLGRTTTPEFGMATVTESRIAGITRNPWDLDRTPGGSSGGSCAMVAARAVPIATATDAGGSIRSPAAHCGLVGLKPSRGRISQMPFRADPLVGLSVSFVVTRSVRDCALALDVCQGREPGDPYGMEVTAGSFTHSMRTSMARLRVAFAEAPWSGDSVNPEMLHGLHKTIRVFEAHGHTVEQAMPRFDYSGFSSAILDVWCCNIVHSIDALAKNFGRQPSCDNIQSSILAYYRRGKKLTLDGLMNALGVIDNTNRIVGQFVLNYDLFVTPTCLSTAPRIGELNCDPAGEVDAERWDRSMNRIDAFMAVFNASGHPAISVPVHSTDQGLPAGIQIVARFAEEERLIQAALLLEEELPWKDRYPACSVRD